MSLAAQILHRSGADAQRIVLLHGFTQNSACWEPFAGLLANQTGMEIVAIDAPGHGISPQEHDSASLWEAAELAGSAGGTAHYVGYSMGGRTALHLALSQPERVRSLTLIGATPGIADPAERAARRAADNALADELQRIGVEAFIDRWLSQPLFAGLTPSSTHRSARLTNRAAGLAASLRACSTGTQDDLRARLRRLTIPTLVIAGENDAKFAAIARELPGELCLINGAGHSAHLERPAASADAVAAFIVAVAAVG